MIFHMSGRLFPLQKSALFLHHSDYGGPISPEEWSKETQWDQPCDREKQIFSPLIQPTPVQYADIALVPPF
jgi:hypothetical protein